MMMAVMMIMKMLEKIESISFARAEIQEFFSTYLGQKNAPTNRKRFTKSPLLTSFSISRNESFGSSIVFTSNPNPTVPTISSEYLHLKRNMDQEMCLSVFSKLLYRIQSSLTSTNSLLLAASVNLRRSFSPI